MALKTADSDMRKAWLTTQLGGNGDYYINVGFEQLGLTSVGTVRISTSGGDAPLEVKQAIADLYRAMEKYGLNEYPDNDE